MEEMVDLRNMKHFNMELVKWVEKIENQNLNDQEHKIVNNYSKLIDKHNRMDFEFSLKQKYEKKHEIKVHIKECKYIISVQHLHLYTSDGDEQTTETIECGFLEI